MAVKYEQLSKGELRTPQGKKVGSFTTNTLPRQVGKPKKRKGQKTSIPQSTHAKGIKRIMDQMKSALDKGQSHEDESFKHPKGSMKAKIQMKKADKLYNKAVSLHKFVSKVDKRFRVK